jgi:hypothetical protein
MESSADKLIGGGRLESQVDWGAISKVTSPMRSDYNEDTLGAHQFLAAGHK